MSVENLGTHGFPLAQHGEHHVLCSHLLAIQVIGLDFRKFEDLLCAGREGDVADDANGLAAADHALELEAKFFGLDVEAFEAAVGLAGRNGKDRTENVLGSNVRVVELAGGGDGALERTFGIGCVVCAH